MDNWTAEITNDSIDDYNLIIEILKNDNFIGRIQKNNNELILRIYRSEEMIDIPANWLKNILEKAEKDL